MTKLNNLLFKILLISAAIFAVSLVFSKKERSEPKAIETAILNPSHKSEVNLIEIQSDENGTGTITLKRQGDFWLLSKKGENESEICTIADSKIIGSLLENAGKVRKIYKITENESDYSSLGISKSPGTTIVFSQNHDRVYTKVQFGYSNPLKNRIYFRSEASKTVYETENDFHQYLTAQTNYWSEGEVFPEIKNPVQITLKTNESSVVSARKSFSLDEKSPDFLKNSHTLLSLRHGEIQSEATVANSKKIAAITIHDGSGRGARLDFFEKTEIPSNGESEKSYFYTKSVTPGEADSQETRFALYSEKAAYEISSWTYERILSIFK